MTTTTMAGCPIETLPNGTIVASPTNAQQLHAISDMYYRLGKTVMIVGAQGASMVLNGPGSAPYFLGVNPSNSHILWGTVLAREYGINPWFYRREGEREIPEHLRVNIKKCSKVGPWEKWQIEG